MENWRKGELQLILDECKDLQDEEAKQLKKKSEAEYEYHKGFALCNGTRLSLQV